MKPKTKERFVLVTTTHRGVFAGWAKDTDGDTIELRAARCCVYWPQKQKGFMGLAANGPMEGARIGPAADLQLRGITGVATCTPEAIEAWGKAPWSA